MSAGTLRSSLKKSAMRTLRSAGVYTVAGNSARRRNRLLILCYHGIALTDEDKWAGYLFISAQKFRERLACLRDMKTNVLPLEEALARLDDGSLPPQSIAITFDDGFYDFLHHAVPILAEFGFPCTLYLTTFYSGLKFPIINLVIDYLLWKSGRTSIDFPEQGITTPMPTSDWIQRQEATRTLLAYLNSAGFDTEAKNEFACTLATRFGIDYREIVKSRFAQILTPDEAAQVSRSGIDIQLHTHRHRTPSDRELFIKEITENRDRITDISGKAPTHFCYPSGNYDRMFLPWLRDCNVKSATTCDRGFALQSSEPLLLPRVLDDSNMDIVEFEGIVSGLFA